MHENTDQKNSEYGHFLRSEHFQKNKKYICKKILKSKLQFCSICWRVRYLARHWQRHTPNFAPSIDVTLWTEKLVLSPEVVHLKVRKPCCNPFNLSFLAALWLKLLKKDLITFNHTLGFHLVWRYGGTRELIKFWHTAWKTDKVKGTALWTLRGSGITIPEVFCCLCFMSQKFQIL